MKWWDRELASLALEAWKSCTQLKSFHLQYLEGFSRLSSANISDRSLPAWVVAHETKIRLCGRLAFALTAVLAGLVSVSTEATLEGGDRFADFRDATYFPVTALLEGNNPYNTREYLSQYPVEQHYAGYVPHHLLLHLPLALLPQRLGEITGFCMSLVLLVLAADAALRLARVDRPDIWRWPLATIGLISWPGGLHLVAGQTSLESIVGVFLALGEGPFALQTLGVVLACQKPQFGLPLVILLCASRDPRRALAGMMATLLLVSIVLLRLVPAEGGMAAWVQTAVQGLQAENATTVNELGASSNSRIDLAATLGRFTGATPPIAAQWALLLAVLAVPSFYLWKNAGKRSANHMPHCLSLAILAILLAAPHHGYDALLLMLPLVVFCLRSTPPWARILFLFGFVVPQVVVTFGRDSLMVLIGEAGFSTVHVAALLGFSCLWMFAIQWAVLSRYLPNGETPGNKWDVAGLRGGA